MINRVRLRTGLYPFLLLILCWIGCSDSREGPQGNQTLGGAPAAEMDAGDIRSALAEVFQQYHVMPRTKNLLRVLSSIPPDGWPATADFFREKVTSIDNEDLRLFVVAYSQVDPRLAMDEVLLWGLESKRVYGAKIAAREWAFQGNPVEVIEYVKNLPERRIHIASLEGLAEGWGTSGDLDGFADFLEQYRGGFADNLLEHGVTGLIRGRGTDASIEWLENFAPDQDSDEKRTFKQKLRFKLLRQVSNRDPVRAKEWLENFADEDDVSGRGYAIVASEWAEVDPNSAIEWLKDVPDGRGKDWALQRFFSRWTRIDVESAEAWFRSIEGTEQDQEFGFPFLRDFAMNYPSLAARWHYRLEGDQRDKFILTVAELWSQKPGDLTTMVTWLNELEMSPELQIDVARKAPMWAVARAEARQDTIQEN